MKLSRFGAATLAVVMTAAIVPAAASAMDETLIEANREQKSVLVGYSDLNLAREADVDALNDRVRRAANRICFDTGVRELRATMAGIRCRDAALELAKPQISAAIDAAADERLAANTAIVVALP